VFGSTSQNDGFAPLRIIADRQEIIVKLGRITSSFGFRFSNSNARSKATLPLETVTAFSDLKKLDNLFSKVSIVGDVPEIFFEFMALKTFILSWRVI